MAGPIPYCTAENTISRVDGRLNFILDDRNIISRVDGRLNSILDGRNIDSRVYGWLISNVKLAWRLNEQVILQGSVGAIELHQFTIHGVTIARLSDETLIQQT